MKVEREHHEGLFARNPWGKLFALLLAVIAWYAIQPAISFEHTVSDVPVRVLVDSGWAVLEQSVSSVDVHFRGSREGILHLQHEQLEVVADARGMSYQNALTIPLTPREVRAPSGTRAVYIRPAEITLNVDQEEDRELPVRVHIQGAPPDGYEVEKFVSIPATVTVSGPRQRLDAIEAIRTTPIDLEGRLQSFKLRVGLVSPSRAWTARMDPDRVEVEVTLTERAAQTVFEEVRVKTLAGARWWQEVQIDPTHVDVELVGRSEWLDALTPRDIQVYVDTSGLDPETAHDVKVRAHLPDHIRIGRVSPDTVRVKVQAPRNSTGTSHERYP